jgi:putative transposase
VLRAWGMARSLRINIAGGWYHITHRGIERRTIFGDDREYVHFLELLGEMHERYMVRIHAYVLMSNHYHLLIRTPECNVSQAMQWLNVSYSTWYNRRHNRVGPLFQGRFKSVLIDGEGAWSLETCFYLHLNPVRVQALGLDKRERRLEGSGRQLVGEEQARRRIAALRAYRWSSFRAYAGYESKAQWLETAELLRRNGGQERMRRRIEDYVKQGAEEDGFAGIKTRLLLGSRAFREAMSRRVKSVSKEQPDRKVLERVVKFDCIVKLVEKVTGKKWHELRDLHGNPGRDMVLYLARQKSGLTLDAIGKLAGGLDYKTVGKAVERFGRKLKADSRLATQTNRCLNNMSNVET